MKTIRIVGGIRDYAGIERMTRICHSSGARSIQGAFADPHDFYTPQDYRRSKISSKM